MEKSHSEISIFNYSGAPITMKRENGVVYVNLTEIAKAFPEKNLSKIINSQEINEYVQKLSEITNVISADLLQVTKGGDVNRQGTWAHQKVALRVCQKLSTQFAIWVDTKIEELLTSGVATVSDDDAVIAQAMQVLQRRLDTSKQRVQILEGQNEHLTREVKQLAPKAAYTDEVLQSTSTYTMTQVAKELGMSAVSLERKLHEAGIMFRQSGQWMLYAKYQGNSLTKPRTHHFTHNDGSTGTNTITVWTERGRAWVHQLWKGGKI